MYNMLIVDDNPHERRGIAELISSRYSNINIMESCANGKQALDAILDFQPDLILSDIVMPIMNGIEMAKIVRTLYPSIKIIFMSCHNEFDYAKSALTLNANEYILKPIVEEDFYAAIDKVLAICECELLQKSERKMMMEQLDKSIHLFQEQFFRELLCGIYKTQDEIVSRMDFLKILLPASFNIQMMLLLNTDTSYVQSATNIDEQYFTVYSMKNIIQSFIRNDIRIFTLETSPSELVVIVFSQIQDHFPPSPHLTF